MRRPLTVLLLAAAALILLVLVAYIAGDGTDESRVETGQRPVVLDADQAEARADAGQTPSEPTPADPGTTLGTISTAPAPSVDTTTTLPALTVEDDADATVPDTTTTTIATAATAAPPATTTAATTTTVIEPSVPLETDDGAVTAPRILGATYTGPDLFCDEWWIDVSWRADAPAGATITMTEPLPDSTTRTLTDMDLWNDGIWVSVPATTDSEVKLSLLHKGTVQDETTLFVDRPGTATDTRPTARAPLPQFCSVTYEPPIWNPPIPELVEGFWEVLVSWEAVGPPGVEVEIYGPLDDFPYSLQGYLTGSLDIPVPDDRDSEIIVVLEVDGREQDRRVLTVTRPS